MNPRTRHDMLQDALTMKLGLKIKNCQDQIEELGVQAYLQLAELDFVHQIVHIDRMKVEVKTCFLWLKIKMVSFVLIFELFIEIIFLKVGFFLQFEMYSTNTISFFAFYRFFIITKCFCSYRVVFDISNAFLHLYLIHVKLTNQHFSTDYGILKTLDPRLYHCSSMDRTFLS